MRFHVWESASGGAWAVIDTETRYGPVVVAEFSKEVDAQQLALTLQEADEDERNRIVRTVALFRASGYNS